MIVKLPTGYGPLFATGLPSEPAPFVSPTLRSIHTPSRRSCSTFTTLPTFAYNQCPHASPGVSPRHASILPAIYMDCRPSYTSTPAISAQSGPILALIPPLVCQPKLAHRKKKGSAYSAGRLCSSAPPSARPPSAPSPAAVATCPLSTQTESPDPFTTTTSAEPLITLKDLLFDECPHLARRNQYSGPLM